MKIELKPFSEELLYHIWEIGFSQTNPEWTKWNAPYFEEYIQMKEFKQFATHSIHDYLLSFDVRCILVDHKPIGMISRDWIDQKTRWMELGIVIYDEFYWGKGIATDALKQWTTDTFNEYSELAHLGFTTWSGNLGMQKVAEKMGWLKEAQIRQVRYWQGAYYDSVKYGVLKEEWKQWISSNLGS